MTNDPSPDQPANPPPRQREPIFNAPMIVIIMAVLLVAAFAIYFFSPLEEQVATQYHFALAPRRFWAAPGTEFVYPDVFSALLTLVSNALLHVDWMHVLVNSFMLLAFGTPVARAFGTGPTGWGLWMIVFLGSIILGSIFYLWIREADAGAAVGASGGTSGLIAAAFLLEPTGLRRKLWSPTFLALSLAMVVANVVLVLMGPMMGMRIAWEAHLGGYIAGALLMAVLPVRVYRAAES